ncbi:hypothetical protein [Amycolatopsis thermophila]|uniref:Tail assembly chaperone n=1 Tax=Amycolatopsis thermophila TaxID=206084 RepID=A0ABU0EMU3_9PSEU|nr:hypothetical protein [Amycolatopsis thermophila]MDQ0376494.1 hypothetical protein [Amycolatopsis thermophila]
MAGVKTFAVAAGRKKGNRKPIPFKLFEGDSETYHVNANLPEDALVALSMEFIEADDSGKAGDLIKAMVAQMKAVFTEDTYNRLMARLTQGEIRFKDLNEPLMWAVEQLTGRPTGSRSAS